MQSMKIQTGDFIPVYDLNGDAIFIEGPDEGEVMAYGKLEIHGLTMMGTGMLIILKLAGFLMIILHIYNTL